MSLALPIRLGTEKSPASRMSLALPNRLGTEKSPAPQASLARLELLYEQLWAKQDSLHVTIFPGFEFPCLKRYRYEFAGIR